MKKIIKWIVIAFIAVMVLAFIFSGDDKPAATADATPNTVAAPEVVETVPVSADELFKAYEGNEVAADQQYKGKMLEITGKVQSIDSGIADQAQVKLVTSNQFMPISTEGDDAFTKAAATLSKGQDVKMTCKGGGEVIGSPMLKDCVIQ